MAKQGRPGGGSRKIGRMRVKCAKYRAKVGKPRGKGVPGNRVHRKKRVNLPTVFKE